MQFGTQIVERTLAPAIGGASGVDLRDHTYISDACSIVDLVDQVVHNGETLTSKAHPPEIRESRLLNPPPLDLDGLKFFIQPPPRISEALRNAPLDRLRRCSHTRVEAKTLPVRVAGLRRLITGAASNLLCFTLSCSQLRLGGLAVLPGILAVIRCDGE